MRKAVVLAALIFASVLGTGCSTVTKSPGEVAATYRTALDIESRQMFEDWNYLWRADRPGRLMRWTSR
ncbi:hypothetical protein RAS1_36430 [Phycisphaerae bacterium RAS1]|nr:hypothetical protein RAS1_36430 [Phycisphaerae bacterium RAS1]